MDSIQKAIARQICAAKQQIDWNTAVLPFMIVDTGR